MRDWTIASSSRLTRSSWRTWPHRKLRRKVPRVDGALTTQPSTRAFPRPQRIGVIDTVAAGPGGGHQGHKLVACVGPARGTAQVQVPVNQLGQAETQSQGGRKDQPDIVD